MVVWMAEDQNPMAVVWYCSCARGGTSWQNYLEYPHAKQWQVRAQQQTSENNLRDTFEVAVMNRTCRINFQGRPQSEPTMGETKPDRVDEDEKEHKGRMKSTSK